MVFTKISEQTGKGVLRANQTSRNSYKMLKSYFFVTIDLCSPHGQLEQNRKERFLRNFSFPPGVHLGLSPIILDELHPGIKKPRHRLGFSLASSLNSLSGGKMPHPSV
jgi:hypothetical protein